ncbi:MAG: phosphatidylcholine/phosphatidylserine synthase [Sphingomonadaceae bacterium]|nr:phosphatidylcholine/phosphatidylserine synthase [Sphingomonadaceae bacterium]
MRALIPNAVTVLALCFGLTGVRFAVSGEWEKAVAVVVIAAVLDGLDGRIARLLRGQTRFGAELDSLSDVIAFGVSPALIVYLWSLQQAPRYGWIFALAHAVCCALRLARFNANIDADEQPHKSAGFMTGVPAPAGAGLLMLPIMAWMITGIEQLNDPRIIAPWAALVAFLMVSNIATFSFSSLRLRRELRFPALAVIAVMAGALVSEPWITLAAIGGLYLLSIPFGMRAYARVKRRRAAEALPPDEPEAES